MRWYVSRNSESSGPHEEATVADWARANQLQGAMLRDEAASAWVPVDQTPFASLVPKTVPAAPAAPTVSSGTIVGFAILGTLFSVYFLMTCGESSKSHTTPIETTSSPPAAATATAKAGPDAIQAWVMSKEFVKRNLKSPGSADFGGVFSGDYQDPKERCSKAADGAWKCAGWVDSQNSFGAKLRANFTVTVKPDADGDSWTLVEGPTLAER